MKQMNCQIPTHQLKDIVSVCMNKQCKQHRLCCLQCEDEDHRNHSYQLFDFCLMNAFLELCGNIYDFSYNQESIYGTMNTLQVIQQIDTAIDNDKGMDKKKYFLSDLEMYIRNYNNFYQKCECYNNFIQAIILCVSRNIFVNTKITLRDRKINLENSCNALIDCQCHSINQNQFLKFKRQPIELFGFDNIFISRNGKMIVRKLCNVRIDICYFQTQEFLLETEPSFQIYNSPNEEVYFTKLSLNNCYIAIRQKTNTLIYNINQKKLYWKFQNNKTQCCEFIFSEDCQFALSSEDQKLKVWSVPLKKLISQFTTDGSIQNILISLDNKLIACHCTDYVQIWDLQKGKEIIKQIFNDKIKDFCFSKDVQRFISCGVNEIQIWNLIYSMNAQQSELILTKTIKVLDTNNTILNRAFKNQIIKMTLTQNEKCIIVIIEILLQIRIIEIASGQTIFQISASIKVDDSFGYIYCSDDQNIFVTGLYRTAKIWKREIQ